MPIRPENRALYPPDWREISRRIRERDGHRCKWCGVRNGALGGRDKGGAFHEAHAVQERLAALEYPTPGEWWWCGEGRLWLRIVRIVLTTAHLDHNPANCADDNLASLCQRCHNTYDAKTRRAGTAARARAMRAVGDLLGA